MNLFQCSFPVEVVKKKWTSMRDYFVQRQQKKVTGSAATTSKRDESMSFLLQTSVLKRALVLILNFFFHSNTTYFFLFSDRFHHCHQSAHNPKRNPPHRLHHLKKIWLPNKIGQTMGHSETISKLCQTHRPTTTAGLLHQFQVYHCRKNERLRKTIRMNSCVHFWPNDRNHPISFQKSQLMVFSNSSIRWHHQFGNCQRWRLPGSSPK